jgi:hypothetical protein
LCNAAVVAAIDTVSVVEAAAPAGVTVAGEKLHVAVEGNPEVQLKETAELNPFIGATEMLVVPLNPGATETEVGDADTEKSGTGRLMV